jgi:hypothetical protein
VASVVAARIGLRRRHPRRGHRVAHQLAPVREPTAATIGCTSRHQAGSATPATAVAGAGRAPKSSGSGLPAS